MDLVLFLEASLLGNQLLLGLLNIMALVDLNGDTDLDVVHGAALLLLDVVSVGPGHLLALLAGHLLALLLGHLLTVFFGNLCTVLAGNLLAVLPRHLNINRFFRRGRS